MSYERPFSPAHYNWAEHDFGAGAGVKHIRGPKGRPGILKRIEVAVTETFNAVTTSGFVRVGTNADPDAYAELTFGTAAINTVWDSDTSDTDAIISRWLPADTLVEVDFVSPTGGTPAGKGEVSVFIDWM